MTDELAVQLARFLHNLSYSSLANMANRSGDVRKSSWGANVAIPPRLQAVLRCEYDTNLRLVLDGPKNQQILVDIFENLRRMLDDPNNMTKIFGDDGRLDIEIQCSAYKEGRGGRLFFQETQKKGLLRKRTVQAAFEYLS